MENRWLNSVVEAYREYFEPVQFPIIFDIGTRDGDDAEFFREKLDGLSSHVYAIDANPRAIWKTRYSYPGFNTIKLAVSDYNGVTDFVQIIGDKDAEGTSSMDTNKAKEGWAVGRTNTLSVEVNRMDYILEGRALEDTPIDIVKVDVESYTWEVLEGFGDQIYNVKVFHLETEREYPGRKDHKNNQAVASFMRACGFFLVDVSYEWGQNIQDQVWVNLAMAKKQPTTTEIDETN